MKFLVYTCFLLAFTATVLSRRDRDEMAMATIEKIEELLSAEMAEEQAYEQEMAMEQEYERELAEEQAYQRQLAEEKAYEKRLAAIQEYEEEMERQDLIAALQSACGRGSGVHVQTLSALADLLSTGEVTAQEAREFIDAKGLHQYISEVEIQDNTPKDKKVSNKDKQLQDIEKGMNLFKAAANIGKKVGDAGGDIAKKDPVPAPVKKDPVPAPVKKDPVPAPVKKDPVPAPVKKDPPPAPNAKPDREMSLLLRKLLLGILASNRRAEEQGYYAE